MKIIVFGWPHRPAYALVSKRYEIGPRSLIATILITNSKSHVRPFGWDENHRPWMTLKVTDNQYSWLFYRQLGVLFYLVSSIRTVLGLLTCCYWTAHGLSVCVMAEFHRRAMRSGWCGEVAAEETRSISTGLAGTRWVWRTSAADRRRCWVPGVRSRLLRTRQQDDYLPHGRPGQAERCVEATGQFRA